MSWKWDGSHIAILIAYLLGAGLMAEPALAHTVWNLQSETGFAIALVAFVLGFFKSTPKDLSSAFQSGETAGSSVVDGLPQAPAPLPIPIAAVEPRSEKK